MVSLQEYPRGKKNKLVNRSESEVLIELLMKMKPYRCSGIYLHASLHGFVSQKTEVSVSGMFYCTPSPQSVSRTSHVLRVYFVVVTMSEKE